MTILAVWPAWSARVSDRLLDGVEPHEGLLPARQQVQLILHTVSRTSRRASCSHRQGSEVRTLQPKQRAKKQHACVLVRMQATLSEGLAALRLAAFTSQHLASSPGAGSAGYLTCESTARFQSNNYCRENHTHKRERPQLCCLPVTHQSDPACEEQNHLASSGNHRATRRSSRVRGSRRKKQYKNGPISRGRDGRDPAGRRRLRQKPRDLRLRRKRPERGAGVGRRRSNVDWARTTRTSSYYH